MGNRCVDPVKIFVYGVRMNPHKFDGIRPQFVYRATVWLSHGTPQIATQHDPARPYSRYEARKPHCHIVRGFGNLNQAYGIEHHGTVSVSEI